ncbi:unnamed protein product [Closterium sp. NIES-65]|nr:unnamed protein product [Closterium sp. NIES-65]
MPVPSWTGFLFLPPAAVLPTPQQHTRQQKRCAYRQHRYLPPQYDLLQHAAPAAIETAVAAGAGLLHHSLPYRNLPCLCHIPSFPCHLPCPTPPPCPLPLSHPFPNTARPAPAIRGGVPLSHTLLVPLSLRYPHPNYHHPVFPCRLRKVPWQWRALRLTPLVRGPITPGQGALAHSPAAPQEAAAVPLAEVRLGMGMVTGEWTPRHVPTPAPPPVPSSRHPNNHPLPICPCLSSCPHSLLLLPRSPHADELTHLSGPTAALPPVLPRQPLAVLLITCYGWGSGAKKAGASSAAQWLALCDTTARAR